MANTSFAQLKKSRQAQLDKLTEAINAQSAKANPKDDSDMYWKPTVDKAGNGMATIRFLPAPMGEDLPFVRVFSHAFQGPTGSWYINNSLTTIGLKDPVGELNAKLWNSGVESDKEIARKQKRTLKYYANVYIEKDSGNPENEGKVKIFTFGKKIFDKLNEAMNPQFEDEQPMNPFDLWSGASFKLKIREVEGYRNYDKSEFNSPAPLFEDEDKMEAVWKQCHSLQQFVDPKNFKTWDELKSKLDSVLGLDAPVKRKAVEEDDESPFIDTPKAKSKPSKVEAADESDDLDALLSKLNAD